MLDAWARQWGTPDELVLLASSRAEGRSLNLVARSTLRTAGRLAGPSVTAGDLELTPGDRVVAGRGGIGRSPASAAVVRSRPMVRSSTAREVSAGRWE